MEALFLKVEALGAKRGEKLQQVFLWGVGQSVSVRAQGLVGAAHEMFFAIGLDDSKPRPLGSA